MRTIINISIEPELHLKAQMLFGKGNLSKVISDMLWQRIAVEEKVSLGGVSLLGLQEKIQKGRDELKQLELQAGLLLEKQEELKQEREQERELFHNRHQAYLENLGGDRFEEMRYFRDNGLVRDRDGRIVPEKSGGG